MTTAIAQSEALEIGILFRKARGSMVESVRHLIEAGAKLTAIKKSLPHKSWLPWLAENADALGFESRATAAALMRLAAKCNVNDTFDEDEALRLSREVWGNAAPRLPKPQRDDDLEPGYEGSTDPDDESEDLEASPEFSEDGNHDVDYTPHDERMRRLESDNLALKSEVEDLTSGDLVERALALVGRMTESERRDLVARIKEAYPPRRGRPPKEAVEHAEASL